MCGRYNVTHDPLAELFLEVAGVPLETDDLWNLAPTEFAPVFVRSDDGGVEVRHMQWWLVPYWSKEPKTRYSMFNARAENIEKSNAFRGPFERRRCAVPASGFFEWVREGSRKQPMYMRAQQGGLMFAGIHDRWRSPAEGGEEPTILESFAIVTTAVHNDLAFVHNRQPVLLDRARMQEWLDPEVDTGRLRQLFQPALPVPLEVLPVSSFVNNARNKEPRCIEALGPSTFLDGS